MSFDITVMSELLHVYPKVSPIVCNEIYSQESMNCSLWIRLCTWGGEGLFPLAKICANLNSEALKFLQINSEESAWIVVVCSGYYQGSDGYHTLWFELQIASLLCKCTRLDLLQPFANSESAGSQRLIVLYAAAPLLLTSMLSVLRKRQDWLLCSWMLEKRVFLCK